jgi:hypothetical protein
MKPVNKFGRVRRKLSRAARRREPEKLARVFGKMRGNRYVLVVKFEVTHKSSKAR